MHDETSGQSGQTEQAEKTEQVERASKIVLGVTGCIGAYKAAEIVRSLKKQGVRVQVMMTRAAQEFITPLTLETLSEEPVITDLWGGEREDGIRHISLTEECDVFVIAPATANVLAKLAHGIADDFLSTFALACRAPLLIAPAMNTNMLAHPAVQKNLELLRDRGAEFVEPGDGWLACGWIGKGRLAEPEDIVSRVRSRLKRRVDLTGKRLLVSAGPTAEPLDPVRVLTNRSSGKMGYRIAEAARDRGAHVRLVSGPSSEAPPAGIQLIATQTAREMKDAMLDALDEADVVIMSAAVADYRPETTEGEKIKKGEGAMTLRLIRNDDILMAIKERRRAEHIVVGFAAETDSLEAHAKAKLEAKGLEMIVGNDVSRIDAGFGSDNNRATLYLANDESESLELMSKRALAEAILDRVVDIAQRRSAKG